MDGHSVRFACYGERGALSFPNGCELGHSSVDRVERRRVTKAISLPLSASRDTDAGQGRRMEALEERARPSLS